jgi:lactoylglutathione lyase
MTDSTPTDKYPVDYTSFVYGLNADKPQILHTMLCVKDLEASERFYVSGLGMKLLGRNDFNFAPRVSGLFVGYDTGQAVLELAHYWDGNGPYSRQPGFGHVAIGVPDVYALVAKLERMGVEVTTPPAVLIPGAPPTAFLKDPDGYEVEVIQTRNAAA